MTDYDSVIAGIRERRLAVPRYPCSLAAHVETEGHRSPCIIENMSTDGLGLRIDSILRLKSNSEIIVACEEIGSLGCTVRWVAGGRAGVELGRTAKKSLLLRALISSFEKKRNGDG